MVEQFKMTYDDWCVLMNKIMAIEQTLYLVARELEIELPQAEKGKPGK